jgi:hypothetical protein
VRGMMLCHSHCQLYFDTVMHDGVSERRRDVYTWCTKASGPLYTRILPPDGGRLVLVGGRCTVVGIGCPVVTTRSTGLYRIQLTISISIAVLSRTLATDFGQWPSNLLTSSESY